MNKKKLLLPILLVLLTVLLTFSVWQLYTNYSEQRDSDAQKEIKPELVENREPDDSAADVASDILSLMDFTGLQAGNPDIIAWLTVEGTVIDYPVVQGTDNSYYITHTAENKSNKLGALFLDFRYNKDFSDFYSIIYGHNMKSGQMFGDLVKFKDKAFFDAHQTGILYTPGKTYRLEIFAVAVTGSVGDYYRFIFSSPAEKEEHIQIIRETSLFYREIGVTAEDNLLALSTCSYEFKDARTVVLAKIILN